MIIFHQGLKKTILFTPQGEKSLGEAEAKVPGNQRSCVAQLRGLLKRFGDVGKLQSPEQLRHESDGIYAVRARCGLRAYGWLDHDYKNSVALFVVGHCVLKKTQKLSSADLERVKKEREIYREG